MKEIAASLLLFVIAVHLLGCCTGLECKIGSLSNNTIGTCPV
uniref:Lipoprotein n=1 Tax=Globodera pallida TaxID=36090 RepID=A0A183CRM2_GLOPA